jgi:hypothetical protein
MKKLSLLFALVATICFTAVSCDKEMLDTSSNSIADTEAADEYDNGIVVEDPDDIEEPEPIELEDRAAAVRIDSITTSNLYNIVSQTVVPPITGCTGVNKYAGYYIIRKGGRAFALTYNIYLSGAGLETVTGISTNRADFVTVSGLTKVSANQYSFVIKDDVETTTLKARSIKITITDGVKNYSKSVKFIGGNEQGNFGSAMWGVADERKKLGKDYLIVHPSVAIDSTYIPQLGDVIYFTTETVTVTVDDNIKAGTIITTPVSYAATRTKAARTKFKLAEYNARCNYRRTTKSQSVNIGAKPVSASGAIATHYYRGG